MKKYFKLRYALAATFGVLVLVGLFYQIFAPAKITHAPLCIIYKNEKYIETPVAGWDVDKPYELVRDRTFNETEKRVYYKGDFALFSYFEPYCEVFDKNMHFIYIPNWDMVLMKVDFVFPTLENNQVEEIWFSLSNNDTMDDPDWVHQVVEAARSNGAKEIDKEIYDYIVANSWDNHCIHLKYEGYPLVEEFFVNETKDGRYIVDQYTAEEYDTIYYDEH